jgi:periplasmic divalent cation tolerance protein
MSSGISDVVVISGISEVIVTADDPQWLASFTRTLVEERLCACAQHFAPIRSIYRWEGDIQDATEVRVALHTRRELVPQLIERIERDHPYEVPCVLAMSIDEASLAYVEWVCTETGPEPGSSVVQIRPSSK